MKEYILNIEFKNWKNQLWFINNDTEETRGKWIEAIKDIESLKNSSEDSMEFQNKVIEFFSKLGFIRIQK